jgi:hypothetical protein
MNIQIFLIVFQQSDAELSMAGYYFLDSGIHAHPYPTPKAMCGWGSMAFERIQHRQ